MKKWLAVLLLSILCLTMFTACGGTDATPGAETPQEAVDAVFGELRKEFPDEDIIKSKLTGTAAKQSMQYYYNYYLFKVLPETEYVIDGDTASVDIDTDERGRGSLAYQRILLVKLDDGRWYIEDIVKRDPPEE